MGGPDLVAAGRPERQNDQRPLHLAQYPVIQPRCRQPSLMRGEVTLNVALNRRRKPFPARSFGRISGRRRVAQFGLDDADPDCLLRIKRRQPPYQIFQLAHIAGPAVGAQPLHRSVVEPLQRQPLAHRQGGEMPDQRGYVGAALAQRRQAYRRDVQAIEQVFPEQTLPDQLT